MERQDPRHRGPEEGMQGCNACIQSFKASTARMNSHVIRMPDE